MSTNRIRHLLDQEARDTGGSSQLLRKLFFDKQAVLDALKDDTSTISAAASRLANALAWWLDGKAPEDRIVAVDALFALIDALPKSTTQQAGGAT